MNQPNITIKDKLKNYFTLSSLPFLLLGIIYFMKKNPRNNVEYILLLFFTIMFMVNLISIRHFLKEN